LVRSSYASFAKVFGSHESERVSTSLRKSRKAERLRKAVSCKTTELQYDTSNIHSGNAAVESSGEDASRGDSCGERLSPLGEALSSGVGLRLGVLELG
jgi:hypothetical protein